MNTEVQKEQKGRLSWVITVLEIIVAIVYLVIGFGGIVRAVERMDFVGIFESVKIAIIFLIIATAVVTALCFVPVFKSKGNVRLAIWNIIWIAFSIYSII